MKKPWRFLMAALALAAVSGWLASSLEVRSSFDALLPSDLPAVRNLKELIRRVGGDGTILVVIESFDGANSPDGKTGMPAAMALAPRLAKEIEDLGPSQIRSVEWNQNAVQSFYENHWPMFLSVQQLTEARDEIKRQARKAAEDAMLKLDDEDSSKPSEWADPKQPMPRERVKEHFKQFRNGFLVHPDGASLTILVRPAGTSLGVDEAKALVARVQGLIDSHAAEMKAMHLRAGMGGTFPRFIVEYEAIIKDVFSTVALCISLVLASLMLFYRDIRSTLALGIAVLIGVAVTFGITRLVIGYLNTQTAFLGSIVVGNGINYGLIYLARVRQLRRAGTALEPALLSGAHTAAKATLLASAGSSVSFGVLMFAANRGFRHFGFIGGVGMLLCWVFTFALVPALMALFERVSPVKPDKVRPNFIRPAPSWLRSAFANPGVLIGIFSALIAVSVAIFIKDLPSAIERNLGNLTNELKHQEALLRDNERANGGTGRSNAGAIALLPSREAAEKFCDVVMQRQKEPRYAEVIQKCETISLVVPDHQQEKLALIHDIQRRLTDKLLGDLSPEQAAKLRSIKADLATQTIIKDSDAPPTLLDKFRERDGNVGRLANVVAQPAARLELAPNLAAFVEGVRNVPVDGVEYDATGENVIFADLLANIQVEGPRTTIGSLMGVCLLVLLFFRRWRLSLDVVGSLIAGVILMGGVAAALHLKINFFNFIVFPITFGIAVDYGANVVVRIQERGGDVLSALYEVGPAVALCSWTSMIGYGSLILSLNRALQSFGWYALVGEITSIIAALVLLPAMSILTNQVRETAPEGAAPSS